MPHTHEVINLSNGVFDFLRIVYQKVSGLHSHSHSHHIHAINRNQTHKWNWNCEIMVIPAFDGEGIWRRCVEEAPLNMRGAGDI